MSDTQNLLLAEDDEALGQGLVAGLRQAGFVVTWVRDGISAEQALRSNRHHAAVLDISLPGRNGLEIVRDIRNAGDGTPVLFLTAYGSVEDRIRGLDIGADDYMGKPFDLDELTARLRALLRRRNPDNRRAGGETVVRGRLRFDRRARQAMFDGVGVSLTPKEYQLLELFLTHADQAFARDEIIALLGETGEKTESNLLDVYIHNLRKKTAKSVIRTVRGVGYAIGDCQ